MPTTQVQVRMPKELLDAMDTWIAEGRFSSRSEAVKTIVALYNERERIRKFYETLIERSDEASKNPAMLLPLEEAS